MSNLAAFVRERFDGRYVAQFNQARDARIGLVTDRVLAGIPRLPDEPHPIDVYDAAWDAAKERDPSAFDVEDDGTEFIADPAWNAAEHAAFAAAVAYGYPEFVTCDERALLLGPWDKVAGASPP